MGYFDNRFRRREAKSRRNYEIDMDLHQKLKSLTQIYDATLSELLNACIEHLTNLENLVVYEKQKNLHPIISTYLIRESNLINLEDLKAAYGISIQRLVNLAIKNALIEWEQEDNK